MTTLELTVSRFVEHKRAVARKYESEEATLRLLVRYAEEHGASLLEELTPVLLDDFLASRSRPRPRELQSSAGSCAACSTGPSRMSCWKPRRCRLARVGKRRRGSRSSSTSPKRDGCSMQPPRSPITHKPPTRSDLPHDLRALLRARTARR